ncbi:Apoptosis-inducing factor 2 [Linnemannia exigua]|uniref:Apoptosis-inducing factor 2 n=1 Tax=Linnemannia exigua TaxID=604196 RepID=A0AAD4D6D9_9FUNG|nr:Apoptosis-inducing factor 2 [Linnemannia exigua]
MAQTTELVKVVVVGGSFAGVATIQTLLASIKSGHKNIQIILIEKRDARHHPIGAFRALVDAEYAKRVWIPYSNLFPKDSHHKIIQDKVTQVHHDHVVLASGQTVAFDYLALCTGSDNPAPAKFLADSSKESIAITNKAREDLKKSKSVVVVGGGACGVELAGEIKNAFPDKKVTLIHSSQTLVDYPGYSPALKAGALTHLRELGVDVVLGVQAQIEGLTFQNSIQVAPRTIVTPGKTIESDIQFLSVGNRVDTSYISTLKPANSSSFDSSTLVHADSHQIKVQKTLQLFGFDNIFAAGDCADYSKVQTAAATGAVAPTIAKNIIALEEAKAKNKTAKLSNPGWYPSLMLLATGPETGVIAMPLIGTRFSNSISKALKSKDLMIGMTNSSMNWK